MNPFLLVLILIASVLLWFILSFLFQPLGKYFYGLYEDAINKIKKEEGDKEE